MAQTDIPTLYSRVVAVNPKAAVPGLEWCPETHLADDETISARWRLNGNTVSPKIVEPILGWHWLGLALKDDRSTAFSILPAWVKGDTCNGDVVPTAENTGILITTEMLGQSYEHKQEPSDAWGIDMLHALAEFFAPTKEGAKQ